MAFRKEKLSAHPDVATAAKIIDEVDSDAEYERDQEAIREAQEIWIRATVDDGLAHGILPHKIVQAIVGNILLSSHLNVLEYEHGIKIDKDDTMIEWAQRRAQHLLEDMDVLNAHLQERMIEKA